MSASDTKGVVSDLEDADGGGSNAMNIWHTLEALVGSNLRKKYHYEGYNDHGNGFVKIFTATLRHRDSFADKLPAEESKQPVEERRRELQGGAAKMSKRRVSRKKKVVEGRDEDGGDDESRLNYPRITAHLERLMGTNVVRLTDRQYMKELRERIDEDYQVRLARRIHDREVKEVERERKLILEGKTDEIPEELADDPIFKVQKQVLQRISKRRSKLKTTREKNAERLLKQGMKWEQECLLYEELELKKQEERKKIAEEQRSLEERYRNEDAVRGLDLLRIDNDDWRECEEGLHDFLVRQRCLMKERSNMVPTRYTSDSKDIEEIVRQRQKFRQAERQVKRMGSTCPPDAIPLSPTTSELAQAAADRKLASVEFADDAHNEDDNDEASESRAKRERYSRSSIESKKMSLEQTVELQTEMIKKVNETIDEDIQKGMLARKEDLNYYFYVNPKIIKLKKAKTMAELFKIADEIITGQVDDEQVLEEEGEIAGEAGSDLEGVEDAD